MIDRRALTALLVGWLLPSAVQADLRQGHFQWSGPGLRPVADLGPSVGTGVERRGATGNWALVTSVCSFQSVR